MFIFLHDFESIISISTYAEADKGREAHEAFASVGKWI